MRYMGVNGALRRVLTRSVLAYGCAPLRLARPPLTPTSREFFLIVGQFLWMPSHGLYIQAACAGAA
ncbi:hypothetical protein DDT54_18520 [Brenneria nigrifluens DSM 30175 = ATCC 13028]|uniref:Uncharacterized protein n=1 Tax=Brenneria nigrifluens DSM 30175 = ATCC 13028 TaxID=1121120 RepID=A0A2U1UIM2_9GAMM|nr:hypothetical protein DDT54_18520 [Brenneria nigrifluens DSM 30175 = ATCC 13028]